MKRIRRGFELLEQSWNVLKADPEMILIAVAGMILSVGTFALFFILGWAPDGESRSAGDIAAWLPLLFVSALVGNFATAAMVGAACMRLGGEDPTITDALRVAAKSWTKILAWSFFAMTVGVVLRLISDRLPFAGRLVAFFGGIAFHLATMLVVPVLLFEDKGVVDSAKRSGELFKERWGESATGIGGIGLATFVMMLPILLVGVLLAPLAPLAGAIVLTLGGLLLFGVVMSLNGIFTAVLYRFATSGNAPPGFSDSALQSSFTETAAQKKIGGFFRRSEPT